MTRLLLILIMAVLTAATLAGPRFAAAQDPEAGEEPAAEASEEADETEDAEEDEEPDRHLAIVGGRVHTISGPVLDGVTVLATNGRITAVGRHVQVPEDAEVIDASGLQVYPGLVAARTTGLLGGSDADDSSDVFSLALNTAVAAGITTARTGNTVAKLTFGSIDDMIVRRNAFETLRYTTRNPNGRRQMREQFERVRQYLRDVAEHEEERRRNPEAEAPDASWIRGDLQRYLRLLEGEAVAWFDVNTTHELLEVCDLVETFGFEAVVNGAYEGWCVAPRLARAGVSAVVTPRTERAPDDTLMRPNGATIENAAILHDHGVPVTFIPPGSLFGPGTTVTFGGLAGRDMLHLPMEAAFAVRGGMTNRDAVRAITLDAARILGVDDRVGSIDPGKDADFIITDGDVLHYMTLVQYTIVNGRVVYHKDTDPLFNHIRPGGDRNAPPPDDYWPRRLGDGS